MMFAKVPLIRGTGIRGGRRVVFCILIPCFRRAVGIVGFVNGLPIFTIDGVFLKAEQDGEQGAMSWGNMAHASCADRRGNHWPGLFFFAWIHDAPFVFAGLGYAVPARFGFRAKPSVEIREKVGAECLESMRIWSSSVTATNFEGFLRG